MNLKYDNNIIWQNDIVREKIPKIIIQTGPNKNLSTLHQSAVHTVKCMNPDFEYLFFDNDMVEDFIDTKFSEFRKVFDAFKYKIQKYDFFRYLAIYQYGGFYFDLDVLLAKNLEALLECECVFSFEELNVFDFLRENYDLDWAVGNYAFGSVPRNTFIKKVIENCVKAQNEKLWVEKMLKPIPRIFRNDFYVLCTTGPGLVTRTIAEELEDSDYLTVLFPENVYDRQNWNHFGNFGVHLGAGNWRSSSGGPGQGIKRFLEQRWFDWMRKRQIRESMKLGPKRSLKTIKK